MEELKLQAEALAEERRKAREQAAEWTREIRLLDSDDDKEKKPRRKRAKAEIYPSALTSPLPFDHLFISFPPSIHNRSACHYSMA